MCNFIIVVVVVAVVMVVVEIKSARACGVFLNSLQLL